MSSKKKTLIKVAALTVLVSAAALSFFFITHRAEDAPSRNPLQYPNFLRQESMNLTDGSEESFIDRMVAQLQKYYGKTISETSTQASLLAVRNFIVDTHPENGKALFYTILTKAFPDLAHEILKTLEKMDRYNRWLEDNKKMLVRMTATEKSAALWAKRRELFGPDAEKIWSGDLLATEARKAKVQDVLAALNESEDTTIDEKYEMYQMTLRDTYTGSPEEFILSQNYILSKVFFSIDSVQNELKQLSPDERRQEINDIRRKMGFSEEQVEALAKRDSDNEKRWETGLKYMQAREEIVREFEGQEQEEKLKALREYYFQDEANTIALEEKDDFFRFKRPRIYGRN